MLRQSLTSVEVGAEDIDDMEKVFMGLKKEKKGDRHILDFNMDMKEIKMESSTTSPSTSDVLHPIATTPSVNVGTPLPPLDTPGSVPLALDTSSLGSTYRTPVQRGQPPAPRGL